MTDDRRQTDHATEKCAGIDGIACAARAIPPKKTKIGKIRAGIEPVVTGC